jgi:hypothetical protein
MQVDKMRSTDVMEDFKTNPNEPLIFQNWKDERRFLQLRRRTTVTTTLDANDNRTISMEFHPVS